MNVIIFRDNSDDPARRPFEDALAQLFVEKAGAAVLLLPHLYHIAEDDGVWAELADTEEPVVFLSWLYPRPAEWLLRRHGVGPEQLLAIDMGAHETPEQCLAACAPEPSPNKGTIQELSPETGARWHPVLDYSRCANCKQCVQFCLFGVYELDREGAVKVRQPDNCKTGCPACSRICPQGAIMFPLYDKDEAIAGAPGKFVTPDDAAKRMFEKKTRRPHRQPTAADDDLDALIDDLDHLTGSS